MKIAAFILAIYALFLASLPALSIMDVFPEVICCTNDHDEHQEDEGNGCSDVCNPFLSCQCSSGFTTVVADHIYKFHHSTPNSRIEHLFQSPVVFSVWHPPRG